MASRKRKKGAKGSGEPERSQRKPKVADRFDPENIPGCNFVVIDDDSAMKIYTEFERPKKQSK
jgi:hypothetical protein